MSALTMSELSEFAMLEATGLSTEEQAKVCIRSILASTTSENIEQHTNFLYCLITGEELSYAQEV